ncbi:MAG TPA: hypothetical protein VIL07_00980 [Symbiobacteriaceae bacterium]
MQQRREVFLNGLLALLVLSSILLSARLLYSPGETSPVGGTADVQPPPPDWQGEMPDVYRPERILVQPRADRGALLLPGSAPYEAMWKTVWSLLAESEPDWSAVEVYPDRVVAPAVTLVLPVPAPLEHWAEQWGWDAPDPSLGSVRIDRVRLLTGEEAGMVLSGPAGDAYRIRSLSPDQRQRLQNQVADLDESLFTEYRPVSVVDESIRLLAGLTVPALDAVPWARVSGLTPDPVWEKIRYFPDLSVVRQIDETNAQSYTDGQRLLRILASGVLEYRTADLDGTGPDLQQALELIEDWVMARGGWPEDLVLTGWIQQETRTILTFEDRVAGPLPVETAGGALRVHVIADAGNPRSARVTFLQRYPELLPAFDRKVLLPVISPEEVLQTAADRYPQVLKASAVRDLYLAYLVQPGSRPGDVSWHIEPVWVIQAGSTRLYIPGLPDGMVRAVQAGSLHHPTGE